MSETPMMKVGTVTMTTMEVKGVTLIAIMVRVTVTLIATMVRVTVTMRVAVTMAVRVAVTMVIVMAMTLRTTIGNSNHSHLLKSMNASETVTVIERQLAIVMRSLTSFLGNLTP
jgi:hypothetical protein